MRQGLGIGHIFRKVVSLTAVGDRDEADLVAPFAEEGCRASNTMFRIVGVCADRQDVEWHLLSLLGVV
jgi:hypothetical protein